MSKLNEAATSSGLPDIGNHSKAEEEEVEKEDDSDEVDGLETKEEEKNTKPENDKNDILKFTMLFNKYNYVLDAKRNPRNSRNDEDKRDNKFAMFFNKEVTIRKDPETPSIAAKILEVKKLGSLEKDLRRTNRFKSRFNPPNGPSSEFGLISYPGMPFSGSLTPTSSDVVCVKPQSSSESLKAFFNKRNPKDIDALMQLSGHPQISKDLRIYKSLTILTKNHKLGLRGALRSKIPSLTALDSNSSNQKSGATRFSYWDHWDDLTLMNDVDKRLNLQISRSSYDNSRRSASKFKKEDAASVSDSKLLNADSESKTHIKKCDKKSRGDSSRKERESGSRKQVQWNTEVDVIYFSIQMAANGDRSGEVIGRVMEPLREEWEQQRKGFYAKLVPSQMESHIKDRFISLLKI